MIYFIGDTHFCHNREFIYKPRGFNTVDEMNSAIIHNWNAVIDSMDDVYMLGDFALGTDYDSIECILKQLNGRIHLIIGNHDTDKKIAFYQNSDRFVEFCYATKLKIEGHTFMLSHYPMYTANLEQNPKDAVFNIHGHLHVKQKFFEDRPYMYNVSCDAQNCRPISVERILDDINKEIAQCIKYLG